ncbi:type IV pilus secretin PilQ [Thermodesulfovibrio thiophilus]|uniref:type IV pilus secretin PilQ n=1 Tax=Thermodesulfovibrio thiophilus TaxID=340095 RepID=UPI00181FF452|nr:type IV pilus secretin PilQ [Thermodesulfovibrio thiophilus]HHW20034.1 type IV pilus secretin PilQ [Thermodesulfovibrio thiophilus]
MINKIFLFLCIYLCIFLFFIAKEVTAREINAIIPEKDMLKIQLTEQFEYTIIPQDDPFKIKIEFKNTKPGVLDKKTIFHEGSVSEVSAQTTGSDTYVNILLAEPVKPEIKLEGDALVLYFPQQPQQKETGEIRTGKIIDVLMDKIEDGFEISIQGDGEFPEPSVTKVDDYINVSFQDVKFEAQPSKDIPVSVKRQGNELILSFFFGKDFDADTVYLGDELILNLKKIKGTKAGTSEIIAPVEPVIQKIVSGEKTISLDLQDADIVGVFRLLGDIGGYNTVIHPDVKGKITLKLINVPWSKALDVMCRTFQLEKTFDGNIIRIAPIKVFQEEKKLEAESKDLFKKAEDEQIRIFVLKYASVDKVKSTIESSKILSSKGNISTDERTMTVIVKDIPSVLQQVAVLISDLDKPTRQILLQSRIVEISSSFSKSLGIDWGINWRISDWRTNIVGSQGATTGTTNTMPGGSTPIAINLPASSGRVGAGTSALTIGYLNAAGTFALDFRISALQDSGKGKIVSDPKVITLNNQKAKIVQGESIPYGEKDVQSGQISTKFKDVAITVEVTPHMIDDQSMLLDVNVIKEDLIEFINIGGTYAPRTTKLESVTKVSLKDGETLVIGGIYKRKDTFKEGKVPGLGDIPLLGELFTTRGRDEDLYEVVIFITPRVLSYE